MATIWTKAEYLASYSICPRGTYRYPDGHVEPRRFPEIRLHYHPAVIKPIIQQRYERLIAAKTFSPTDKVVVFGAGFGWMCEELTSRIGCVTIGLDNSQYILDNKNLSPDDELLESIQAAGYNITDDPGKQIWEQFKQTAPRTTANIQNYDVLTVQGRQSIVQALGGKPTHVITEDVWQYFTPQEQNDLTAAFTKLGAVVIHIIGEIIL